MSEKCQNAPKGRGVLKSIQQFRTDALIKKVSPEMGYWAPVMDQREFSYFLSFSNSLEKKVSY